MPLVRLQGNNNITEITASLFGTASYALNADKLDGKDGTAYELVANKSSNFSTLNNTLYPTTQAVDSHIYTRARTSISESVTGLDYNSSTGMFSTTSGYGIPTTVSQSNWDLAYTNRIMSASAPLSIASNTISISQATSGSNGYLTSTDWTRFDATKYQLSTGLLSGGTLSINADTTKFDIQAGTGYIINSISGSVTSVSWATQTAQTTSFLTTDVATYVLVDSSGVLVKQNTYPTPSQLRTLIYIGKLAHTTKVAILFTVTEPCRLFDAIGQIMDLNRTLGSINIEGNVLSANGANLNVNISSGMIYRAGANYVSDRNNPSITVTSAGTAISFRRKYRDALGGWNAFNSTLIDPNFYDNGTGTLASVSNNKYTTQLVWRFGGTGTVHIDYGQAVYNTMAEAIASISTATVVKDPDNVRDASLRGWLVVKQGVTDLSNSNNATFIAAGKFGEGTSTGGGTTTLQQAYNNSITPEIVTNASLGALSIQNGEADDTATVFEGKNIAGTNTFTVNGSGSIFSNVAIADTIAYFNVSKSLESLPTSTYPSLTELSYVKGVTGSLQTQLDAKANDSLVVHLSGTETISGAKTFSSNLSGSTANFSGAITGSAFVKTGGTSTQFLKADGTVDSNTYLTSISSITAGGELSGSYPNPTLVNSAVTGKVLTGLNITGTSILATDSILTAFGKIQNQVNSLVGSSIYQGVWNATTNSPTLTSSVGTKGYYYKVSVSGSTNLDGITDWNVGDWVIFNGSTWDKVDNTDSVSSVNGFTGAVNLTTTNVTEGTNLYYLDSRARASISETITGIDYNNTTGVFSTTSGYGIPTTVSQSNWDTAYSWGNHAGLYAPLSGSVSGLGTAGHYVKYTGANTIAPSSIIYDYGTDFVIGSDPSYNRIFLDLAESGIDITGDNYLYLSSDAGTLSLHSYSEMYLSTSVGNVIITDVGYDTRLIVGNGADNGNKLQVNGSAKFGSTSYGAHISTDGVLSWGISNNTGQLSWDTGKAIVRATSGNTLNLGANGSNDHVVINSSGNVGIGTTSPNAKLSVFGNIYAGSSDQIKIIGGDNGGIDYHAADGTTFNIRTTAYNNPIVFSQASGERLRISPNGNFLINTTTDNGYKLQVNGSIYQSDTSVTSYFDGNIRFGGTNGYNTIIKNNGNVGIGTTNPLVKLNVYGGAILNQSSTGLADYIFGNADGGTNTKYSYIGGASGGYITFGRMNDDLVTKTEFGRFDGASGNFLINTTTDNGTDKLQVNGNGLFKGELKIDDAVNGRVTILNQASQNDIFSTTTGFGSYKKLRIVGSEFVYRDGNSSTDIFSISTSGAATFASTVTASNGTLIGGSGTSNWLSKFTGTNTIGKSDIYIDDSYVFIQKSDTSNRIVITPSNALELGTLGALQLSTTSYTGRISGHNGLTFGINHLNVGEGGTEVMRLTNSGNLLINSTTDNGINKLQVNGSAYINTDFWTAGDNGLWFNNNTYTAGITGRAGGSEVGIFAGSSERVRVNSSGNVGIGTTSPTSLLDVNSSTPFTYAEVPTSGISLGTRGTGGSVIVQTPSLNSNYHSGLAIDGSYSSSKSTINLKAFGVYSGGPYSSDLTFSTSTGTTLSEKVRITSSGNVGINTTTPTAKLTVKGDDTEGQLLLVKNVANGTDYQTIKFMFDTSNYAYQSAIRSYPDNYGSTDGSRLSFWTQNSYNTLAERLTIKGNGNVGINQPAPTAALHIKSSGDTGWIKLESTSGNPQIESLNGLNIRAAGLNSLFAANGGIVVGSGYANVVSVPTDGVAIEGNLLLGTTTDTGDRLNVNGDGRINGSLLLQGTLAFNNSEIFEEYISGPDAYRLNIKNYSFNSIGIGNTGDGTSAWMLIQDTSTTINNSLYIESDGGSGFLGVDYIGVNYNVNLTLDANTIVTGDITAASFIKSGGTSSQFLKANGSVDSTAYAPLASPSLTGTPTAPTATVGTNTTQIATTAFVQTAVRPYKVYTAYLTQTGTSAPVATVFENTLGGTVVWTRNSTGNYSGTLSGVFTANTYLNISNVDPLANSGAFRNTSSEVKYVTTASGSLADGVYVYIEIRVYN